MSCERLLHPAVEPHASGWLPVAQGHAVYWEQFGNRAAPALLWLHGGPGSGCSPRQRRQFDPARWHVTFFDQRGCGRSRAANDLQHNTPRHLMADIERLRCHLGIARWTVCGGSWGATQALAYAAAHGETVEALALRSVFLANREAVQALLAPPEFVPGHGAHAAWRALTERLEDMSASLARPHFNEPDGSSASGDALRLVQAGLHHDAHAVPLALAWTANEQARQNVAAWSPAGPVDAVPAAEAARLLRRARVQVHYLRALMQDGLIDMPQVLQMLQGWSTRKPLAIVHGAADGLCDPAQAERVRQALGAAPSAVRVVPGVGHDAFAEPMLQAWHAALAGLNREVA